jgi:hypothetical protein
MEAVEAITDEQVNEVAISAIIAEAAYIARGITSERARWHIYNAAKKRIDKLNPTGDEYERAIALLTQALNI